jgi:6-phosphogluconolactonase (cycloisomerase 2 family)
MMNISRIPKRFKLFLVAVAAFCILATTVGLTLTFPPVAKAAKGKTVVFIGYGTQLVSYDADLATGKLTKGAAVTLPGYGTEGFVHPSRKYLYVSGSRNPAPVTNVITAYKIDPESGALTAIGEAAPLPTEKGGYVTAVATDRTGKYVMASVSDPSSLVVTDAGTGIWEPCAFRPRGSVQQNGHSPHQGKCGKRQKQRSSGRDEAVRL